MRLHTDGHPHMKKKKCAQLVRLWLVFFASFLQLTRQSQNRNHPKPRKRSRLRTNKRDTHGGYEEKWGDGVSDQHKTYSARRQLVVHEPMLTAGVPPRKHQANPRGSLVNRIQRNPTLQITVPIQDFREKRKQRNPQQKQQIQPPQSRIGSTYVAEISVMRVPPHPRDEEAEQIVKKTHVLRRQRRKQIP
jgi:hypothetical protein